MKLTGNQNSALVKIEKQDRGEGVPLRKVTGDALIRKGLVVQLRNGRYTRR